jgi:myo-inositol-1(or 4)-monophosphatase
MKWTRLLEPTVAIAREAGSLLMNHLGQLDGVEYKGTLDLVTDADRASETLLVERLAALLPGAGILAEEGSGFETGSEQRWIVDPLDGTTNFAHGYPVFAVSIALESAGERVLGVVHDPTRNECFTAVRGEGAHRNGEPLRVGAADRLDRALLVTGFPYDVHTADRDNLTQFRSFLKQVRAVRRDGSAALNLAYVAAGRFDGFWEEALAPWDMAAGALLVEEAGGEVTGYLGRPLDLKAGHLIAANPSLRARMETVLAGIERANTLPPLTIRTRD